LKIAEVLSVDVSSFFQNSPSTTSRTVFPSLEAMDFQLTGIPGKSAHAKLLTPVDFDPKAEPFLIEILPKETLLSHFFIHKGDEMGYMLSGKLVIKMEKASFTVKPGDVIYLTSEMPLQWKNPGPGIAKLLWIKLK
jgi:quercetin dioxygenase-like cupin family protein